MITHVYTVVDSETGEIRRYIVGAADYASLLSAGEAVCAPMPVQPPQGTLICIKILGVLILLPLRVSKSVENREL
jgi:hypothetical protein